jgi:hypothetical protein
MLHQERQRLRCVRTKRLLSLCPVASASSRAKKVPGRRKIPRATSPTSRSSLYVRNPRECLIVCDDARTRPRTHARTHARTHTHSHAHAHTHTHVQVWPECVQCPTASPFSVAPRLRHPEITPLCLLSSLPLSLCPSLPLSPRPLAPSPPLGQKGSTVATTIDPRP